MMHCLSILCERLLETYITCSVSALFQVGMWDACEISNLIRFLGIWIPTVLKNK
jgi:hypothetical protein